MIIISVQNNERDFVMEISAGIAGAILHIVSPYSPIVKTNREGNCVVSISIDYIDQLNKDLVPYKKELRFDKSFIDWKAKNRGKKPLLIRAGVNHCTIYQSSDCQIPHKELEDAMKYFFLPAVNQKSYKDKKWDGYIKLYVRYKKQFPTGLLHMAEKVLTDLNIPYKIEWMYDRKPPREFDWQIKHIFTPSEDQMKAVRACVEAGRCVAKASTGFGKTAMLARYLTVEHAVPTLFIANKKVLLDDAANDFRAGIDGLADDDVTQIKDGWFGSINLRKTTSFSEDDLVHALDNSKIIVATIQSLSTRLNDERTRLPLLNWLHNQCKFVMIDEAQSINDKLWQDVLNEVKAPYRVALSATPKRNDGGTMLIFAQTGDLAFDTTADEQIQKGRLCELDIEYHIYDHKMYNENDKDLNYTEMYNACIVNGEDRNNFIVQKTFELLEEERQVLVLIQFIEHGHLLKEKFLEQGVDVDDIRFIWGDTPDKQRNEAIDGFRKNRYRILIGSTIADAGLNIPSIGGVVLCGAGNSDITHIQRIGRGSRTFDYEKNFGYLPKFVRDANGMKVTRVIDILDTNVAFFKRQAKNRYYNACEEFGAKRVHIVGGDRSVFRSAPKASKQKVSNEEAEVLNKTMFDAFKGIDADELSSVQTRPVDDLVCDFLKGWK